MFTPRLSPPELAAPYWRTSGYVYKNYGAGCSPWSARDSSNGSVLPNCTSYAWGRFYEILQDKPALSRRNAANWFSYTTDGYERGQLPRLGAIACWSGGSKGEGHVAVVEEIHDDGSIVTSESGYYISTPGKVWIDPKTRRNDTGRWGQSSLYQFQGFIYNPAVEAESHKDAFVKFADSQIGKDTQWICNATGLAKNLPCNAAFVVACAKSAGILNTIIPSTFSCTALGRAGVLRNMGQWLKGPGQGSYPSPEVGDIVMFRNSGKGNTVNTYNADGCGIVTKYVNGVLTVAQASTYAVQQKSYNNNSTYITGYFRPDWDQVDTAEGIVSGYNTVQGLYTNTATQNDAAVREICYLNSSFKPSIQKSGIRLSALNYTGLLGNLYSVFGGALASATDSSTADQATFTLSSASGNIDYSNVRIDGLTQNQAVTYTHLTNKGLSTAVVCGIMGNIAAESKFSCSAIGDKGTAFGICQWRKGRADRMKERCGGGDAWKTNLSGQLDYLWEELNGSESATLKALKQIQGNTEDAVYEATRVFMIKFERPANQSDENVSKRCSSNSLKYWNSIVKQL